MSDEHPTLPVFHQSNGELLIKEDSETIEKML
jgi:hypothetical protein